MIQSPKAVMSLLCGLAMVLLAGTPAHAILVTYTGAGANLGLNATADFSVSGNQLTIVLTNTSVSPFGGVNGDAAMVLSSINFNLGGTTITGGSVALTDASDHVVNSDGAAWGIVATGDLQDEFGYSNTGIGNTGTNVVVGALQAITSHSNGGTAVTDFSGGTGLPGGLDYSLVAADSTAFGNSNFILDSVTYTLALSAALPDLSFLGSGSYVEFGSDFAFVSVTNDSGPGGDDDDGDPVIPEPATLLLTGLGLGGGAFLRRRQG